MDDLEAMVAHAQLGDDRAFGQIVERFQDMAYYTALRYVDDPQQARDAAQDAFIDAHRSLSALRDPRAFPAWFRRILFKHAHRQIRGRRPLHLDDDTWRTLASDAPGPGRMLERLQRRQAVRAAIQALPEIYRSVTERYYLQDQSTSEIALRLDLSLSAVKKRLYTARQLLKETMDPMTTHDYRPSQDDTFARRVRFFIALRNDDLVRTRQLLRRDPELLNLKSEWGVGSGGWHWPLGVTPLHWAATAGNQPLAALLVEAGAAVNARDQGGNTPLKHAVHMGQTALARWLLEEGADPNLAAGNGQTPLHAAVLRRRPDLVALLLEHGADPEATDSGGRTPLAWARIGRAPHLARALGGDDQPQERIRPLPTETETIWESGIKIVDLVAPLRRGGLNALLTPLSGVGVDVMLGELIHRMAACYDGVTVQLGLSRGDFDAESRLLQWRNYGAADQVELFFGDAADSAGRRRHLAERGVRRAADVARNRPVLLLVYTDLALSPGVMELLARSAAHEGVVALLAGIESMGAEPAPLAAVDNAFTFDRLRARQGLWPAVDLMRSRADHFENETHRRVADEARRLATRYHDLHAIYEQQGLAGFDMALYGEAERLAAIRARRLHHFLAQPLFVAEPWSATPGEYAPLHETLSTTQAILDGELDEVPEEDLTAGGRWSPRWT